MTWALGALFKPSESLGLVTGQPDVHGLASHPDGLGHPESVSNDPEDGFVALFHLAEIPEYWATPSAASGGWWAGVGHQPNT